MRNCKGPGCEKFHESKHSEECLFQHFLFYTGYWDLGEEVVGKLRRAYYDGLRAGDKR